MDRAIRSRLPPLSLSLSGSTTSGGRMISLEGKVALVTGARRGIGAAVAPPLAAQGMSLALASRSGDDLGIEGAVAAPCDVRRPGDLASLADAAAEPCGGIHIIVCEPRVRGYTCAR